MVQVELPLGQHTVRWEMEGYEDLVALINVTETGIECVNVTGGSCNSTTPPGVVVSDNRIVGYMLQVVTAPPEQFTSFDDWKQRKWGGSIQGKLVAILELISVYFGTKDLGFTVTLTEVLDAIKEYFGIGVGKLVLLKSLKKLRGGK